MRMNIYIPHPVRTSANRADESLRTYADAPLFLCPSGAWSQDLRSACSKRAARATRPSSVYIAAAAHTRHMPSASSTSTCRSGAYHSEVKPSISETYGRSALPAAKGAITSPAYGLRPSEPRAGTEPGIFCSATKAIMPSIARRPAVVVVEARPGTATSAGGRGRLRASTPGACSIPPSRALAVAT
eukprot:scaffold51181_cov57-Phaeocystis_antarctica.AAC.3